MKVNTLAVRKKSPKLQAATFEQTAKNTGLHASVQGAGYDKMTLSYYKLSRGFYRDHGLMLT